MDPIRNLLFFTRINRSRIETDHDHKHLVYRIEKRNCHDDFLYQHRSHCWKKPNNIYHPDTINLGKWIDRSKLSIVKLIYRIYPLTHNFKINTPILQNWNSDFMSKQIFTQYTGKKNSTCTLQRNENNWKIKQKRIPPAVIEHINL